MLCAEIIREQRKNQAEADKIRQLGQYAVLSAENIREIREDQAEADKNLFK